jgi:hypothetical protein
VAGSLWGNPGTRHQVYRRSFGEYAIWFSWLFIQSRAGQQSADMKNPRCGFPHRKSGLPDLRTHKKTDLGQARDRRTLREFQFHE